MAKFRKKPVVVDAVQLTKATALSALMKEAPGPFGLHVFGTFHPERRTVDAAFVTIDTLEGKMRAGLDDWIIRGVAGELYPCKPDIFEATYEPTGD